MKNLPAQISFLFLGGFNNFFKKNSILTTKHWHISLVRSTENPAARFHVPATVVAAAKRRRAFLAHSTKTTRTPHAYDADSPELVN